MAYEMTDESKPPHQVARSWDNYWRGEQYEHAYTGGGSTHPVITAFWANFFESVSSIYDRPRIIDIAGGSGAVVELACSAFSHRDAGFYCLDISDSAMAILTERLPDVHGIVADARAIPLVSGRFDIATSQFGIEYAGLDAIDEILRLMSPGGRLAMLVHHRSGGIYRQCAASLDAVRKMVASGFIPRSIDMLEAGFHALRTGLRAEYDRKARALVPALRTMESILQSHGQQVADGAVLKLYRDVRDISARLPHYEPSDVLLWLRRMEVEVEAYAGRMASMCDAAIDADTFSQFCDQVRASGFEILRNEPLIVAERDTCLAWALIAVRS